jgi:hypothetical protein
MKLLHEHQLTPLFSTSCSTRRSSACAPGRFASITDVVVGSSPAVAGHRELASNFPRGRQIRVRDAGLRPEANLCGDPDTTQNRRFASACDAPGHYPYHAQAGWEACGVVGPEPLSLPLGLVGR